MHEEETIRVIEEKTLLSCYFAIATKLFKVLLLYQFIRRY